MTKKLMDDLNSIESLIRSEDHFKLAESRRVALGQKKPPFILQQTPMLLMVISIIGLSTIMLPNYSGKNLMNSDVVISEQIEANVRDDSLYYWVNIYEDF